MHENAILTEKRFFPPLAPFSGKKCIVKTEEKRRLLVVN